MSIQGLVIKKGDNKELTKDEIFSFVNDYNNNIITDYQAAALITSIFINGMTEEEIVNLTVAMAQSGKLLKLGETFPNAVDKHSTGGVGDKVTFILSPIIAALGVPVAKMSGRGLGFTGGTIDKIESIPGFKTDFSMEEFKENLNDIGISLIAQTSDLAPIDKKMYALRDAIGCTRSIPLIASSVMSKKIALGVKNLLLDVTVGSGAFMKTSKEADSISRCMKKIGELAGINTTCILTDMSEPLGYNIGNALEIIEAVECLKGNMPDDIKEIVYNMGAQMLKLSGVGDNIEENINKIDNVIKSGKAYEKFIELVERQGGDSNYVMDTKLFGKAKYVIPVFADNEGYVKEINAELVGSVSVYVGAGRAKKEDTIDSLSGVVLNKKIGEQVKIGEAIAYIHTNNENVVKGAVKTLGEAFTITSSKVKPPKKIIKII